MPVDFSKYDRVLDLVPEMVIILDQEGRIVDHNKSAADQLENGKPLKSTVEQYVVEGKREHFHELLHSRSNGISFDTQLKNAHAEVMDVTVDVKELQSADESYTVLIIKDITEQKKRDLDYLRFANVIQHTINPIQITDASGLMVYVNPAFERWSGYTKEELIGRNPKLLSSKKHTQEFWQQMWSTILGGKVWLGYVENRRKDGTPLHTELLISPIVDNNNNVVGFLGAHRDITEQKLLEQQLMQSQKMESIGTLAAGIAHEVGNPLTSISSLVQVIQRTTNDEFAKEKLELIKNQINRIARTIRDLVDFSRPSTYVERATDVNRVIQDALNIVKYGKKVKEIDFQISLTQGLPKLMVVPDQLTQVFINILMNAVDSLEEKPGTIWIRSSVEDSKLVVSIQDTGKGINPDNLEKIFEPFFTTKEVGKGTGLGLWVSYGIVKNFGGDIQVSSQPGKGSTFTVILPLKGRSDG